MRREGPADDGRDTTRRENTAMGTAKTQQRNKKAQTGRAAKARGPKLSQKQLDAEIAAIEPEPGPPEVLKVKAADLTALGLPTHVIGGEIVSDDEIDPDPDNPEASEGRWLVFRILGMTFGVGYSLEEPPWGGVEEVELTIDPPEFIEVEGDRKAA